MPLPNGVDPWGRIHAICPSAGLLGNRGILHGKDGVITKPYQHKSWVACDLHFKGRKQTLMQPGRYSQLFFLDEATALAAGHRPCGECRKLDYQRFKAAWIATQAGSVIASTINEIDKALHDERVSVTKEKKTFEAPLNQLPFGVMFERSGRAYLHCENGPFRWSPSGYTASAPKIDEDDLVTVLTPKSIVDVIRRGYVPQVHASASAPASI
jgi:hypothetical protein